MAPILQGDIIAAFGLSASLAHVRNGSVIGYFPFPTIDDDDPSASGIDNGLFASNSNALIFRGDEETGAFFFAGSYFQLVTFFRIDVIVRLDLDGTTTLVQSDHISDSEGFGLMINNPCVEGGVDRAVAESVGPVMVRRFSSDFSSFTEVLRDPSNHAIEQTAALSYRSACDMRYHFTSISPATSGGSAADICLSPASETVLFNDDGLPALRAFTCIPAYRSLSGEEELLYGIFSNTSTWAHRRRWDTPPTLLSTYTGGAVNPRVQSICQDYDDNFFWAGHFPVTGQNPNNLYKFNMSTGGFDSYFITREEGSSNPEVRGVSTIWRCEPTPPSAGANWFSTTLIGAN